MYPLNSTPGSGQQGVLNQVYGVSRSHGVIQIPMLGTFSIDPKFAVGSHGEQGTNHDVLTTQSYKNAECSFDIMESDLFALYNLIMDLPPELSPQTTFGVFPSKMYQVPFVLFGNQLDSFNKVDIEGFVMSRCRISSLSESKPGGGDGKLTVKVTGVLEVKVAQGGVLYSRLVSSAPPYPSVTPPQPADIVFASMSPYAATITKSVLQLPDPGTGNTGTLIIYQLKNGAPVPYYQGLTAIASSATITPPSAPASTDVWDLFTAFDGTSPAM